MHPDQESWDDERMAALFASANHQAVPPDDAMLKRLREESAEVFASEFPKQPTTSTRRHRMFVLAMRGLAATVAAAVLFGGWLHFSGGPADTAMALDRVLAKVGEADTLKLEITQGDESRKAWAKQPGRLRIDNPDGTYTIAHGDRAWLVDEEANRASSEDSSYFPDEKAGVDLLALVDLGDVKREAFKAKGAAKRVEHEGRACELHTFAGPAEATRLLVEALVDAKTQQLCYLEAMTVRDGKTESIGKVSVLAIDEPVDEALFVVGDTLTEDGRIGKVTDVQGIVSVKPVMARRFTPLAGHILLKPGDWVRTDVRGANAVAMRLVKSADVTLGPGTLVEVTKPNKLRVHSGELKVAVLGKAPIELVRPDGKTEKVKAKKVFRVDDEKLATLEKDPLWLQGFEGTIAHDSIGSLVAKVEGRNVPLTVGYHKVTVDVRDQIARTVIEESFVNHTDSRLEGIFYFPLPQDASISGFAMLIGDKLTEADLVEK